jgi:hypothetical protein
VVRRRNIQESSIQGLHDLSSSKILFEHSHEDLRKKLLTLELEYYIEFIEVVEGVLDTDFWRKFENPNKFFEKTH